MALHMTQFQIKGGGVVLEYWVQMHKVYKFVAILIGVTLVAHAHYSFICQEVFLLKIFC